MNHFSFATMKVKVRALLYALILAQLLATLCFMGYGLGVAIAGHYDAMQPRSYVYSLRKDRHGVAGLSCADHGGPLDPQITDRMVYWKDVPSDSSYVSPYVSSRIGDSERYLTFETDFAGWNNVRMAFETATILAVGTGRTLVLPPKRQLRNTVEGASSFFGFDDFFHLDSTARENAAFRVVTMEEFLNREALAGRLRNKRTNEVQFPPNNATYFGEIPSNFVGDRIPLFKYLRSVAITPEWDPTECALGIPERPGLDTLIQLNATYHSIMEDSRPTYKEFVNKPTPVDASSAERLREMLASRDDLCLYDEDLQDAPVLHLRADMDHRLMTHFYAFLFFDNWQQDLWSKRFVRDHLRMRDEIMCAAARVVEAVLARSSGSQYDAIHVRRGDLTRQYHWAMMSSEELYEVSREKLNSSSLLYIATDEVDRDFFELFERHYNVVYLEDFADLLADVVNPHMYPIIDQLVVAQSRTFVGTYGSSFSGYINRLRGYQAAARSRGHNGIIVSGSLHCAMHGCDFS